jgi:signal transduction histidine kinase/sugar lactone lactonase YvrE
MYNDSTFFVAAGKNIFTWNHTTNDFKNITPEKGKRSFTNGRIITDKEGLIWMSSWGAGLFCYNPISKTIKNYRNNPKDSSSIGSNYFSWIKEDNAGNLWIGTAVNGLNSFNKKTGKFTRYPFIYNDLTKKANNVLDDATVLSLLCDKEGILWIGTNLGSLNRFDTKTGKFTSYLDSKTGFTCIRSLYEDSHNRLWAGSYLSGVFLVNKDSGFLKHLTEKDGLSSNDINGINEDKKGNIWFSTSHGLSKLDAATYQITNYTSINGLSVVQTLGIYKSSGGIFYVPVKNSVIPFDPDNIVENKVSPQVIIESVKYYAADNNRDSILFTEGLQKVALKYNENKISFQYVALHFSNASLNQYAYQLEGYDKEWIQAGTQRSVTYTNLSPGSYTFKVKAANSDGVWNERGARFTFTILPPWWLTWWAYTLYGLIFLGALRVFSNYRERRLRKEKEVLELKVNQRTKQLQESIESLKSTQSQLIQSEKMASLGELTAGIAHEIQNPLNFVNNFSEVNKELLTEMNDEIQKGNYEEVKALAKDVTDNEEKINFHGKRADAIVKGMLQHSRSSSSVKEPTDINALADEYLRLAYHGLRAKDKSFNATLKTDFDESIGNINIIPQDIGRVILNLITNAFYVVDEKKKSGVAKYEPTVSVSTSRIGEKVTIKVTDNGNGIPQKVVDKIFQPFFTTKPTGQGTGLGLSLSYDIVKAHGGELNVETKEREGTTFTIQLPANA